MPSKAILVSHRMFKELIFILNLHFAKSSKRSSKDWMLSPGSQRQYNNKYAQHNDASGKNVYFRGNKRGYHRHEGITSYDFESWGLKQIKKTHQREKASDSSSSSSSSKSSRSSSSTLSKPSFSSSKSAKEVDNSSGIQEDAVHINTVEATGIERESI